MTRTVEAPKVSEKVFQATVLELAHLEGWLSYHTHDSRRSAAGFPDLVLVRPPRVIFAELKTAKGAMSPQQRLWIAALGACEVEAYIWRPADWPDIEQALRRNR